jgi:hypothetical protein
VTPEETPKKALAPARVAGIEKQPRAVPPAPRCRLADRHSPGGRGSLRGWLDALAANKAHAEWLPGAHQAGRCREGAPPIDAAQEVSPLVLRRGEPPTP